MNKSITATKLSLDFQIRIRKILYTTISLLLILYFIIQLCEGLSHGFATNESYLTEFLINYEGGFVRRGLLGQLLLEFCKATEWSPVLIPVIFSVTIFCIVIVFYFLQFRKRHINWWILLCPLMFGMALDVVRKDYLTYIMAIFMLYLIGKNKIKSSQYFITLLIIVFGLFVHEAFIFYGVPLILLIIYQNSTKRLFGVIAIGVAIFTFSLLAYYKGNYEIATEIIHSWDGMGPDNTPLVISRENSIGSIGWDTVFAIKYHIHRNFNCPGFGWYGLIWQPLIMIVTYYFIMNFTAVFSDIRYSDKTRTVISSLAAFNLICLLPMFLFLSCDYGRLYQYVFAVTYAAFLIVPHEKIINLFPSIYINFIDKFNSLLNRIIKPSKGMMILFLLFFAVNPYDFNPAGSIRMSVIYTDFHWLMKIIQDLLISLI